jgi:hypothetical protein
MCLREREKGGTKQKKKARKERKKGKERKERMIFY